MTPRKSITAKILIATLLAVLLFTVSLVGVMTFFMNTLTDHLLLQMMQPMAKTAAQGLEANLHTLADRLFMMRDNEIFTLARSPLWQKEAVLRTAYDGIELEWLGLYNMDGSFYAGSGPCPEDISGREMLQMMEDTQNLVIENNTLDEDRLQVLMGVPVQSPYSPSSNLSDEGVYLVGAYKYDVLADVLRNINISAHSTSFIINNNGDLIGHRDTEFLLSHKTLADVMPHNAESQPLIELMIHGQSGSATFNTGDGPSFLSYAPIRGTSWSLAIMDQLVLGHYGAQK